jgi:5-methylcytosine-specific restriction endonuclease McrA
MRNRYRMELRRALQKDSQVVTFTIEMLEQRMTFYHGCWICKSPRWDHVDHVKPLSKGGPHMLANLRPACAECNQRKGSKWPFPT